jgi:ketosteroid isomerase-like protein
MALPDMNDTERARAVAERVAAAFAGGNLPDDDLFDPDATGWHNTDEIEAPYATAHGRWAVVRGLFPDFHAIDTHVHAWATGFAMQYVFVGNAANGTTIRIPGCIVATLRDGRIARMQEYVDSAHAAPLMSVLEALNSEK